MFQILGQRLKTPGPVGLDNRRPLPVAPILSVLTEDHAFCSTSSDVFNHDRKLSPPSSSVLCFAKWSFQLSVSEPAGDIRQKNIYNLFKYKLECARLPTYLADSADANFG